MFDYGVIDYDDYETYNLLTVWLSADGKNCNMKTKYGNSKRNVRLNLKPDTM